MANIHISKGKKTKNAKKWEEKKLHHLAWPGFEPGSLDPKSNALPTELLLQSKISRRNSSHLA